MNKDWDYAQLAQQAKKHGSPAELLNDIYDDGYHNGSDDTQKQNLILGAIILTCFYAWHKNTGYLEKKEKQQKEKELEVYKDLYWKTYANPPKVEHEESVVSNEDSYNTMKEEADAETI